MTAQLPAVRPPLRLWSLLRRCYRPALAATPVAAWGLLAWSWGDWRAPLLPVTAFTVTAVAVWVLFVLLDLLAEHRAATEAMRRELTQWASRRRQIDANTDGLERLDARVREIEQHSDRRAS